MLLQCSFLCAQKMPVDYFEEGYRFFENEELDSALNRFNYIVENYSDDESFGRSLYNTGAIYWKLNRLSDAKAVYEKILNGNLNETEDLGGNIMSDPYTNFKHRAATHLSDIFYEEKDYSNALKYLNLADTVYKYIHWEANASEEEEIFFAIKYANIYDYLNMKQKAISSLLPCVFFQFAGGESKEELYEKIEELFKKYKYTNVKENFDESLRNYKKEMRISESRKTIYYLYYVIYYNTKIYLPNEPYKSLTELNENEVINDTKKFGFYKFLQNLVK